MYISTLRDEHTNNKSNNGGKAPMRSKQAKIEQGWLLLNKIRTNYERET